MVRNETATSLKMAIPEEARKNKSLFVASFSGYFKESVFDAPNENNRLRVMHVNYFVEDDTIEVYEPRTENSSVPQVRSYLRAPGPRDCFRVPPI